MIGSLEANNIYLVNLGVAKSSLIWFFSLKGFDYVYKWSIAVQIMEPCFNKVKLNLL